MSTLHVKFNAVELAIVPEQSSDAPASVVTIVMFTPSVELPVTI